MNNRQPYPILKFYLLVILHPIRFYTWAQTIKKVYDAKNGQWIINGITYPDNFFKTIQKSRGERYRIACNQGTIKFNKVNTLTRIDHDDDHLVTLSREAFKSWKTRSCWSIKEAVYCLHGYEPEMTVFREYYKIYNLFERAYNNEEVIGSYYLDTMFDSSVASPESWIKWVKTRNIHIHDYWKQL